MCSEENGGWWRGQEKTKEKKEVGKIDSFFNPEVKRLKPWEAARWI